LAKRSKSRRPKPNPESGLGVQRSTDGRSWVLVHPASIRERAEDLDEVRSMIEAKELEIATDELRWLLADCPDFIAAHALLGELALETSSDLPLARGHFGAGYQLGLQALRRAEMPKPLLYSQPANRPFFAAGQGLAACLARLDKLEMAREIVETLVALDSSDPLKLRAMLDDIQTGGKPVVGLSDQFPPSDEKNRMTNDE
jgi:hypothetical protein